MDEQKLKDIISQRLWLLILKNGLSQTNFGVMIGKAQPRISEWINGKTQISMIDYINIFEVVRWRFSIRPEDWYQFESNSFLQMRKNPWER